MCVYDCGVCICVWYVYMHVMCVYMHTYVYMFISIYVYTCIYSIYMCTCACIYMCVYMFICIYMCMCVHVCIYYIIVHVYLDLAASPFTTVSCILLPLLPCRFNFLLTQVHHLVVLSMRNVFQNVFSPCS